MIKCNKARRIKRELFTISVSLNRGEIKIKRPFNRGRVTHAMMFIFEYRVLLYLNKISMQRKKMKYRANCNKFRVW